MNAWSRFLLRLRQRALRCYELGMLTLLLAIAVVATLPATAAQDESGGARVHCGQIQSNTVVIVR